MTTTPVAHDDLRALVINCTLKRSPERSHTEGLIDVSRGVMERQGVQVEVLRAVDIDIATGVWPDMTEHGWETDEWPVIYNKVEQYVTEAWFSRMNSAQPDDPFLLIAAERRTG